MGGDFWGVFFGGWVGGLVCCFPDDTRRRENIPVRRTEMLLNQRVGRGEGWGGDGFSTPPPPCPLCIDLSCSPPKCRLITKFPWKNYPYV